MRISDWSSDVCSSDLSNRQSGLRADGRIAVAADDDAADDGADREDQPQPVAAAFEFICIFGDADGADVGVRGSKSRRGGRHAQCRSGGKNRELLHLKSLFWKNFQSSWNSMIHLAAIEVLGREIGRAHV